MRRRHPRASRTGRRERGTVPFVVGTPSVYVVKPLDLTLRREIGGGLGIDEGAHLHDECAWTWHRIRLRGRNAALGRRGRWRSGPCLSLSQHPPSVPRPCRLGLGGLCLGRFSIDLRGRWIRRGRGKRRRSLRLHLGVALRGAIGFGRGGGLSRGSGHGGRLRRRRHRLTQRTALRIGDRLARGLRIGRRCVGTAIGRERVDELAVVDRRNAHRYFVAERLGVAFQKQRKDDRRSEREHDGADETAAGASFQIVDGGFGCLGA
jgi:hypothetical protein